MQEPDTTWLQDAGATTPHRVYGQAPAEEAARERLRRLRELEDAGTFAAIASAPPHLQAFVRNSVLNDNSSVEDALEVAPAQH